VLPHNPGFPHESCCRALAAAVLGDPNKVRFQPYSAQQRFTALQ